MALFNSCLSVIGIKTDGVYTIGDIGPAGGIIFYINPDSDKDGWKYLEAATEDLSGCWGEGTVPDARLSSIGSGKSNTHAIIKAHKKIKDSSDIAAQRAVNYRGGGKSDWFLPSKDELNALYLNLHKAGPGNFKQESYWSSTETEKSWVYIQIFWKGEIMAKHKKCECYLTPCSPYLKIRPIRSF